jgi:predicted nuclease of predicted toxin-antitoxin system
VTAVRYLVNENVSRFVIQDLRSRGHDVRAVEEVMRAADDDAVLARAQTEHRIIVTHDKGFGELAFRYGLPADCGMILLRLAGTSPEADNRRAVEAPSSGVEFGGHFSVVMDDRIRTRHLPSAARSSGAAS